MATTFLNMQDEVLEFIALSNDSNARAAVKRFLNQAARDVWHAHPWRERKASAFVNTVAPYETGTATFTENSTTVTGSGTTWTTAMIGRKIALSLSDPYYVISKVPSGTSITLDRAYIEDTASGSTYVIYNDVLALTTMDELVTDEVVCFDEGQDYPMTRLTTADFFMYGSMPVTDGTPDCFRLMEDSNSTYRIQVHPVPDDVYGVRYSYLKQYTDMSNDSDTCAVDESRRDIVIAGACARAYRWNAEFQKATYEDQRFQLELSRAISRERRLRPQTSVLRPVDQARGHHSTRPGSFRVGDP